MAKFTINFLRAYCLVVCLVLLTIGGLSVINEQAVDDSAPTVISNPRP